MAIMFGTPENDDIFGNFGRDIIQGLGRDDSLVGNAGDDVIYGDNVGGSMGDMLGEATGLNGTAYNTTHNIESLSHADWKIANIPASATFTATDIDYPNGSTDRVSQYTYFSDFLGNDASSLSFQNGSNDFKVKTVAVHFTGYIYIPEGEHSFGILSDDGFRLRIGNEEIVSRNSPGFVYDSDTRYYEGGVYSVDLVWYQNEGDAGIEMYSSLPGDLSDYLYASLEDTGLPLQEADNCEVHGEHGEYGEHGEGGEYGGYNTNTYYGGGEHGEHGEHGEYGEGGEHGDCTCDEGGTGRWVIVEGEPPGDDTIQGDAGNDTLYGGAEDDSLYGGTENDSLSGDDGNDFLDGGSGADWQFGGVGDDVVAFDFFDVFMGGGTGSDTLLGTTGDDDIRFDNSNFDQGSKNAGFESVFLGDGSNLLIGGGASDLESSGQGLYVEGGADRDIVSLWEVGDDIVDARGGTDTVYGGPGSDVIFGGDDRDFLYPGADGDTVYGGAGDDVYHVGLGDGSDWLVDAHDGSENNGLILFHGYNDTEWDDYYGVNPDNFSYVVEDVMVDSGSGPQLERVVTISFDNGEAEGSATYQDGEVRFIAGTIETLNLWDHTDVHGGGPPTAGDFTVYQYQWNETTESFDAVS